VQIQFHFQATKCVMHNTVQGHCITVTSDRLTLVLHSLFPGLAHLDTGKDFSSDGLGFNKKKKKKRRHR
jgi:cobalamin synthase